MIALFLPTLGGGGAERNMVNLAGGLAEEGREVALVLSQAKGPYLSEVPHGVEVVDLGRRRVAAALIPLARFLRHRRPSALLSTPRHANLIAIAARGLARAPTRLVVREANAFVRPTGLPRGIRDRTLDAAVRWLYPRADAVVAVSDGVAADLRERTGLDQVVTLPNAAVPPGIERLASQPVEHAWLRDDAPPVVLAVGSLTVQKDFPTLLAAFRRLRDRQDCRLIVLGEGPERARLEAMVARLGFSEDVDMPGFHPNPFAFMARARLLALSSRWEGWPNVCAQALAVGTPVVATDCPHGPREILAGGAFGELVPVADPDALADAIERTLKQPPDADRLRQRSREFTVRRAVAAYLELLDGPQA